MNGHIEEERLALYAGGDLPEEEAVVVREHVAACRQCAAMLAELAQVDDLAGIIANETPSPVPANFSNEVMTAIKPTATVSKPVQWFQFGATWHKVAAAAAILVTVFWAGRLSKNTPEDMQAGIETQVTAEPAGVTVDGRFLRMLPVMGPFPADELPESAAGVYIVLYRPQPDADRYTVEYVGERSSESGNIIDDIACLVDRAGSRANIFIVLYPMPAASEDQRARVAQALIQTYKPYCNSGV